MALDGSEQAPVKCERAACKLIGVSPAPRGESVRELWLPKMQKAWVSEPQGPQRAVELHELHGSL